ncbi:sel1 repeat family protein [Herbaspirillum sp. HC18]|nr:sel1 repeat family protein [Herbaspirillum sp. HC18]
MAVETRGGKRRMRCFLGAALLCLIVPIALAGPKEDTEQAEKEFANGNLVGALGLWRKAADQGNALAQARLGDMLDKAEDDEEAVKWYRKSAAQGEPAGEFGLGEMYAKGEGVKQDFELARKYIGSAADKGFLSAMIVMRDMYKTGSHGIQIDLAKSAEWAAKVAVIIPKDDSAEKAAQAPKKGRKR